MDNSIDIFDGPDEPSFRDKGLKFHHFPSTSISNEEELPDVCWNKCLVEEVKIPSAKLRDDNGKWQRPAKCCSFESDKSSEDHVTDSASNFNQEQELADKSDEGDREEADAGT